jgi:hypothetical protein
MPIIYPDLRLDYKVATHPLATPSFGAPGFLPLPLGLPVGLPRLLKS